MQIDSLMEYERIWVDGLNRGDASAADEAFRPDCIVHVTGVPEPLRGVGQWKEFVAGFLRAFPDFHLTIEHQLVQGDLVAFRWHATGTHTGPLGPAPATGKRVAIDGLILDRAVGGKVRKSAGSSSISRSCSSSLGLPDLIHPSTGSPAGTFAPVKGLTSSADVVRQVARRLDAGAVD